jgi:hypothetical protein
MTTSDYFTIVVRSSSKTNTTDNTNNCTIRMKCPSQYKYIQVYGVSFFVSYSSTYSYNALVAELRADNIDMYDSFDTSLGAMRSLAFENVGRINVDRANMNFKCGNFNNKDIKFQLLNQNGNLLTQSSGAPVVTENYNQSWIIVMKCKGLME